MSKRRELDYEDDEPPPRRGKKKRKHGKPMVLFAILGFVAFALLVVGAIILIRSNSKKPTEPATAGGGKQSSGPSGASGSSGGRLVGPELVTNGSFEDGPEPEPGGPAFTPYVMGVDAIPGWAITRGSIDYIGPYWQHADGKRSIDLNGNAPGSIEQIIRTQPGKKYRVTFSMAGNNCGAETIKTIVVRAAGNRSEFAFDASGRNYENMGWVVKSWEFTAIATETVLEFASTTDLPIACGPAIDRVTVREVGG
jgi:choice-of-anchor C domain-containing protein